MPHRYEGKVVLITGTGGGQGREAALGFAREGALVLGADIAADRADETCELVLAEGGTMRSVQPLDLTDPEKARSWVASAVEEWGRIDVVYNNAAGLRFGAVDKMSLEDWDFTLRNELTIHFVVAAAAWPHLVRQGRGVILNVASAAALREISLFPAAAHGAANAGIIALSRHLASEGARHGIRSLSISPGQVDNPNAPSRRSKDPAFMGLYDAMTKVVPMGRLADVRDVVNAALFLASDDAAYITGIDLPVDGGLTGVIMGRPDAVSSP